jgi:hypothetical protein
MIDRSPNPSILSHLFGGDGFKPAEPVEDIDVVLDRLFMPRIVSRSELDHAERKQGPC